MKATCIKWDTDGDKKLFSTLPTEIEIPEGMTDEDEISDYLSDVTGYCHEGFTLDTDDVEVEFVSYDGHAPNLCSGTLTIKVNNETYTLENALLSGGHVSVGVDGGEYVATGLWSLYEDSLPEKIRPYKSMIEDVVNANVPHGCCGGCI